MRTSEKKWQALLSEKIISRVIRIGVFRHVASNDPDQTAHTQSDQGLCCPLSDVFGSVEYIGVQKTLPDSAGLSFHCPHIP